MNPSPVNEADGETEEQRQVVVLILHGVTTWSGPHSPLVHVEPLKNGVQSQTEELHVPVHSPPFLHGVGLQ